MGAGLALTAGPALAQQLAPTLAQAQQPAPAAATQTPSQATPATPAASPATAPAEATITAHGISIFGDPKLPPDFKHLPYVNPDAPKGGEISEWASGGFDSFNPYTITVDSAAPRPLMV